MSTISNKFFIQVLEDGSSLHGQLLSLGTLTQSYKEGGTYIPNWASNAADRPLVYLSLMNGSTVTTPNSGYTWKYNGPDITFSSTMTTQTIGKTTYYGYASTDGLFFKTGTSSTSSNPLAGNPALGIIGNLANSANTDIDVIRFEGAVTLSTNPITFACDISVTITQWVSGGYLGIINAQNGNIITEPNQSLTLSARLYNDSGAMSLDDVYFKWFIEPASSPFRQGYGIYGYNEAVITASDVTDYAIIRCEFWITNNNVDMLAAVAFCSIDDQQDPEYMWIKTNGANGNTTSLRTGEIATISICVGTADDPTPLKSGNVPIWKNFKVRFLDSNGTTVTSTSFTYQGIDFDSPDSDGYRTCKNVSDGVATLRFSYNDVYDTNICKKGLTGIVAATTA